MYKIKNIKEKRSARVKNKIKDANSINKPVMFLFRSCKHIYAQIIDLGTGHVLCSSSSISIITNKKQNANIDIATEVGKDIANKAKKLSIETIVFNKGSYSYHGQVAAVANGARENGLSF